MAAAAAPTVDTPTPTPTPISQQFFIERYTLNIIYTPGGLLSVACVLRDAPDRPLYGATVDSREDGGTILANELRNRNIEFEQQIQPQIPESVLHQVNTEITNFIFHKVVNRDDAHRLYRRLAKYKFFQRVHGVDEHVPTDVAHLIKSYAHDDGVNPVFTVLKKITNTIMYYIRYNDNYNQLDIRGGCEYDIEHKNYILYISIHDNTETRIFHLAYTMDDGGDHLTDRINEIDEDEMARYDTYIITKKIIQTLLHKLGNPKFTTLVLENLPQQLRDTNVDFDMIRGGVSSRSSSVVAVVIVVVLIAIIVILILNITGVISITGSSSDNTRASPFTLKWSKNRN